MILTPNQHLNDPFVYNRAGFGIDDTNGEHVVVDVLPRSPAAAAGIAVGDQILAVDGVRLKETIGADELVFTSIRRAVGTVVHVTVQHGKDAPEEKAVTLRDML
jgi:C-terminal processing protease CtpA/Prc